MTLLQNLTQHPDVEEWLISPKTEVPIGGGLLVHFVIGVHLLPRVAELERVVQTTIERVPILVQEAEPFVRQYCDEYLTLLSPQERPSIETSQPSDIRRYVSWGTEWHLDCVEDGDAEDGIYISVECGCDWDREHGLSIVISNGLRISRIGPFDGHLTNSRAYGDRALRGVVFKSFARGTR